MSPFSRYLKDLRIRRGFRQKELAHNLGYEPSYLSALERSEKGPPKKDFIERLIRGLELTDDEITALNEALQASRRQLVLPPKASDEEYAFVKLLAPRLGHLNHLQLQLMSLALCLPESSVSCGGRGNTAKFLHVAGKEGRTM